MDLESPTVVRRTGAAVCTAAPGLCIVRVFGVSTADEIDGVHAAMESASEAEDGFAMLVIIGRHAPPPKGELRTRLSNTFLEFRSTLRLFAGVVEGDDLNASVKRTILRVILALGRVRCPTEVHKSVEAALAWMSPKLPVPRDATTLEGFCAEVLYPAKSVSERIRREP